MLIYIENKRIDLHFKHFSFKINIEILIRHVLNISRNVQ